MPFAAVFFDARLGLSSWWWCVWEYFYPLEIFTPSPPLSPQGFFLLGKHTPLTGAYGKSIFFHSFTTQKWSNQFG